MPATKLFAGTGVNVHKEGPALQSLFCKPCRISVKFDHVVYVTDIDANRVNIITTMKNTSDFLKSLGKLKSAFSVQEKGKPYTQLSIPEASSLITDCHEYLLANSENIRSRAGCTLPSLLKGPHGNVADITTESLGMLKSGVNRLHQIVKVTNLLSCLTLDSEHFDASQHFKSVTMSMQHYCMMCLGSIYSNH